MLHLLYYVKKPLERMAQFRSGTAHLHIETGQYEGIYQMKYYIQCVMMVLNMNYMLCWSVHSTIILDKLCLSSLLLNMFCCLTKEEQLKLILGCTDEILVKGYAKTCQDILIKQRNNLYQK